MTSRMTPPPVAVTTPITARPKTSSLRRIPTSTPENANATIPARSRIPTISAAERSTWAAYGDRGLRPSNSGRRQSPAPRQRAVQRDARGGWGGDEPCAPVFDPGLNRQDDLAAVAILGVVLIR